IPPAVMPSLIDQFPSSHQIILDGPPIVKDTVYQRTSSGTAADWHTTLVAGFGQGGPGYYALDVTDPEITTRGAHSFSPSHGPTLEKTQATPVSTDYGNSFEFRKWSASGCTGAVPERSVSIVRLDTAEIIRSFMRSATSYEPAVDTPSTAWALLTANAGARGK